MHRLLPGSRAKECNPTTSKWGAARTQQPPQSDDLAILQSYYLYQPDAPENAFSWNIYSLDDFTATLRGHDESAVRYRSHDDLATKVRELFPSGDGESYPQPFNFNDWERDDLLQVLKKLWDTPTVFQKTFQEVTTMSAALVKKYDIEDYVAPHFATLINTLTPELSGDD